MSPAPLTWAPCLPPRPLAAPTDHARAEGYPRLTQQDGHGLRWGSVLATRLGSDAVGHVLEPSSGRQQDWTDSGRAPPSPAFLPRAVSSSTPPRPSRQRPAPTSQAACCSEGHLPVLAGGSPGGPVPRPDPSLSPRVPQSPVLPRGAPPQKSQCSSACLTRRPPCPGPQAQAQLLPFELTPDGARPAPGSSCRNQVLSSGPPSGPHAPRPTTAVPTPLPAAIPASRHAHCAPPRPSQPLPLRR